MPAVQETVERVKRIDVDQYRYGFETLIESDKAPKGLSEDTVRFISAKKNEPAWMLEWRLEAYRRWLTMTEPTWARVNYPRIDYQDLYYYSAPKPKKQIGSLDEIDPEILKTYEKLGIPLREVEVLEGVVKPAGERKIAVDAVFDSVSVATTFQKELKDAGVIFMPISEAIREHPELVKKYLGTVVPTSDNYFATLNSAVFSDGSFVYVPPGVRCPMELSTYFRINERNTGQFERTLIIADKGAYVSYLEGCTAPQRDENQLHAAVVELVTLDDAEIKYSTVQNWYPGNSEGVGGIYNFVTKRGDCRGNNSKISWTQVETGSAITWKYPSCILRGDNSRGEFYSIAISNGHQQVDSGTKMIHLGKNTTSRIISKGIAAGVSQNTYRGLVTAHRKATGARNFTACDSLLIGDKCGAHTVPYVEAKNSSAHFEHEATTSKISEDVLFYCIQRGLSQEEAVGLVVNGFVKDVLQQLPMEFAVEAQKLISISLEGSRRIDLILRRPRKRPSRRMRGKIVDHVLRDAPDGAPQDEEQGTENNVTTRSQRSESPCRGARDSPWTDADREPGRGARDHGAERLRQIDAEPCDRRQAGLRSHRRRNPVQGRRPAGDGTGRARRQGRVPGVPVSGRNSGCRDHDVLAHRAQCPAQGARRERIFNAGLSEKGPRSGEVPEHPAGHAQARRQCRIFRRREEAQRNFADGAVRAGCLHPR